MKESKSTESRLQITHPIYHLGEKVQIIGTTTQGKVFSRAYNLDSEIEGDCLNANEWIYGINTISNRHYIEESLLSKVNHV